MQSSEPPESSLILGRYRVVHHLAQGGMGKVLLGRLEGVDGFKRPVVLKIMRPEMRVSEEGNRLFRREAQILSRMQHPSIPNILDFGVEDGAYVMALEYVHGYPVSRWLDYRHSIGKQVPLGICLFIVRRVLDALQYAHEFLNDDGTVGEIVHRDVAADNVLLDRTGYVYLLDFGIASMNGRTGRVSSASGVFRGKLGYAAPETLRGEAASPRADQYSAAILLLELLTLETPFQSDVIGETVQRMAHEPPPRPSQFRNDIPEGFEEVLMRALEKDPGERFASVREFSRELRRFQSDDDDELAEELKRIVERDFDLLPATVNVEPLQVREEALAKEFRGAMRSVSSIPDALLPDRRSNNTALWGALVLLIFALTVAMGFLMRDRTEQVVVVGGSAKEREPEREAQSKSDVEPEPPRSPEEALTRSIHAQGTALEACFMAHLELAEKNPEAMLHFKVPARARKANVEVQPKTIAASPLGACLQRAAEQIDFPEPERALSFRIPVRARFARAAD